MSWKQPIPTDINYNICLTALDRAVFREVLSLCQNETHISQFIQAGKHYAVTLKRGQCIFKITRYAAEMEMGRKRISKSLEIVSKVYTELDIKGMPFGCLVTVKDYDNLTKMNNELYSGGTIKGQSRDNQGTTNKSVKSDKSDKSEKKNIKAATKKIKSSITNTDYAAEAASLLAWFNALTKKNYIGIHSWAKNYAFWREIYSDEIIRDAIECAVRYDSYFEDHLPRTIRIMLYTKDKKGDIDKIGEYNDRFGTRLKRDRALEASDGV